MATLSAGGIIEAKNEDLVVVIDIGSSKTITVISEADERQYYSNWHWQVVE